MSKDKDKPIILEDIEWGNQDIAGIENDLLVDGSREAGLKKAWMSSSKEKRKQRAKAVSKGQKRYYSDPKARERSSKLQHELWKDKDHQKKMLGAIENRVKNHPTWSKNHQKKLKEMHNDPKWRKKLEKLAVDKRKEVVTPFGEFVSRTAAQEWFTKQGYHVQVGGEILSKPHLYYYKDEGPGKPTYETVWHSPYGSYITSVYAWYKAHQAGCEEAKKIKNTEDCYYWFNKMKKRHPELYYKAKEERREWLTDKEIFSLQDLLKKGRGNFRKNGVRTKGTPFIGYAERKMKVKQDA